MASQSKKQTQQQKSYSASIPIPAGKERNLTWVPTQADFDEQEDYYDHLSGEEQELEEEELEVYDPGEQPTDRLVKKVVFYYASSPRRPKKPSLTPEANPK